MTKNELLLLPPCHELDKWLTENVLGWMQDVEGNWWLDGHFADMFMPQPSRKVDDAFELENKLIARGWHLLLDHEGVGHWEAEFYKYGVASKQPTIQVAKTVAHAIVKAVVGVHFLEKEGEAHE
jgi:hypothetical protein